MPRKPRVHRLDANDERVREAMAAEARLFQHYGLTPTSRHVEVEPLGLRLRILEIGRGPVVVLVPGGNGELFELVPLLSQLDGFRRIAIGRPGGGMSDALDHRKIDHRELAEAVLEQVLDTFELSQAAFVANSLGGTWGLWFAQSRPERVSSLALVGCPAFLLDTSAPLPKRLLSVPILNRLLFRIGAPTTPERVRGTLRMLGTPTDALNAMPEALFETAAAMFRLPTYKRAWLSLMRAVVSLRGPKRRYGFGADGLRSTSHAVLLLWGQHDPFGGVEVGERARDLLPDARMEVLDAGHVPYLDRPAECGEHIRAFLTRTAG